MAVSSELDSSFIDHPIVLVTGATGWLGKRVVQALTIGGVDTGLPAVYAGRPVRCLVPEDQPAAALDSFDVEIVRGSITDAHTLDKFTDGAKGALLLHLAGVIHPPATKTSMWQTVNVDGTRMLADRAATADVRRLVVMSSNSPMGANPRPDHLFTEESPHNPYMGYGRSKQRMEIYLNDRVMGAGGPEVTILRAPWFYGPGQPLRQTRFFRMIRNGKFPIFAGGVNRRSMGYVDNLAQGVLRAGFLQMGADQVFWIADREPYAMHQIVETVSELLRDEFGFRDVKPWRGYPAIVPDIARMVDATIQSIGLYHPSIHVLSEMNLSIACSVKKAETILGYQPRVSLRDGMQRSIQWCLDNGIEI